MRKPVRPTHGNQNNYQQVLDRTHDILNGGIDLGSMDNGTFTNVPGNANNTHAKATAPNVANTEFTVTHNLNRIPTGFHVVRTGVASVSFYDSGTAWTKTQIFLKCTVANAVAILQIY